MAVLHILLTHCLHGGMQRRDGVQERQQAKPWSVTAMHMGVLLLLLMVTPFLPSLLQINAFALRILVTVAGGLVAVVMCTVLFISVSEAWQVGA